ncbi:hypothetical protein [Dactylococcopsis salina]|uniref:hypothetical protein n=1 Tax=Dactylococcopsis salina TaxID=292566 RepID=UPI0002F74CAC|nr:hypothetical protein [Dactylococcopsis salina]
MGETRETREMGEISDKNVGWVEVTKPNFKMSDRSTATVINQVEVSHFSLVSLVSLSVPCSPALTKILYFFTRN